MIARPDPRPLVAVLFALTIWPGLVLAGQDLLSRMDAVALEAQSNNARALAHIVKLGEEFTAPSAGALQREYWVTRATLEFDAAQHDAAKNSTEKLRQLAQREHDPVAQVYAVVLTATELVTEGKLAGAMALLEETMPSALTSGDAQLLNRIYRLLGNAQLSAGKFDMALQSYLNSLKYADLQPRQTQLARLKSLNGLSNVYAAMKNPQKALEVIDQALVLANQLGLKAMQATLYVNQGGAYAELGRAGEYMRANQRALKLSIESGQLATEATVLNNISDFYLLSHRYDRAQQAAQRALLKYRQAGDQSGAAVAQANLGFALMGQHKTADGVAQVQAAIQVQHDSGALSDEEGILAELGRMYEQAGLYRDAVATIRAQQKLSAQLFRTAREKAVASMQEQYDSLQRQKQIELLARANALKDAEIRNQRLEQLVMLLGVLVVAGLGLFVFRLYHRVRKTNLKLRQANEQLAYHSMRDPLTGLFNRRSFLELMKERPVVKAGARRDDDMPDGLMILDIDHFKHINDSLGHSCGDSVLIEIGKRLRRTVRDTDMVIRWGGEEFLIYSPKSNVNQLTNLAERLLNAIAEEPVVAGAASLQVSVCAGFLSLPFSGLSERLCDWERALKIADTALYLGKLRGRNRAYGLARLLSQNEAALALLESDIAAAVEAQMVELIEVLGPSVPLSPPSPHPAEWHGQAAMPG